MDNFFFQSMKNAIDLQRAELWGVCGSHFPTFIPYLGGLGEGWGDADPSIIGLGETMSLCPGNC